MAKPTDLPGLTSFCPKLWNRSCVKDAAPITPARTPDLVIGEAGNSLIATGAGAEFLVDRGGSDRVTLGAGDDILFYDTAPNPGAKDVVTGGLGNDTLVLNLTAQEWLGSALQTDIARILTQMGTPAASGAALGAIKFRALNLAVNGFDAVRVFVDRTELTLADPATAVADGFAVQEGGMGTGSVTANDLVLDRVAAVQLVAAPTEFLLSFAPDGRFTFDAGQTHDVTIVYRVTDANGDTAGAIATATITGTNDFPVIAGTVHGVVGNFTSMRDAAGKHSLSDIDADALTVTAQGTAHYGSFAVDGTGAWTYRLDPASAACAAQATGTTLTETFDVTVTDGHGGSVARTVSVDVVGIAPVAGSMVIDQTRLADFAGPWMTPTILGTPVLTNNQRQPIATSGPVSDFSILFSTTFLTGGIFGTPLTPGAHLHVIAANTVVGATVVTGMGGALVSVRGGTAYGSTFGGGAGVGILEINALGASQSIDASILFGGAEGGHFRQRPDRGRVASALYGGEANDLFLAQGTTSARNGDIIDGGAGVDGMTLSNVLALDASAGPTFDVLTQVGTVHVRDVEVLTIQGTTGSDRLIGGAEGTKQTGNFGDDLLQGGAGNDWFTGFMGSAALNGGAGDDTFDLTPATDATTTVFIQGYGVGDRAEWVTGFDPVAGAGHDVISVSKIHAADGLLVDSFGRALAVSHQTLDGVLSDFGAGNSLMLAGLLLDQLSANDCTFA